jgi:hypothetical protein
MSGLRHGGALVFAWILLGSPILGAQEKPAERSPTSEEQERFIASTREAALAYSDRLPDFVCAQTVDRFVDHGHGLMRIDSLTFETTYYRRQEVSKPTFRNGSPASQLAGSDGLSSRGEFGENLRRIFAPNNEAQFHFEKWTSLRGQRAAVYSYQVDRSKAPYLVAAFGGDASGVVVVGLRGEIVVDAGDFSVLRVVYIADGIPSDFPVRSTKITVDYENAGVGGVQYLLPSKAVVLSLSSNYEARNESVFRRYRKFSADSVIDFGGDVPR